MEDASSGSRLPTLLKYVLELDEAESASTETASDGYWRVTTHLIRIGLASEVVRQFELSAGARAPAEPTDGQVEAVRRLLAALTFEMVADQVEQTDEDGASRDVPNFDRIPGNRLNTFKQKVFKRVRKHYDDNYSLLKEDAKRLWDWIYLPKRKTETEDYYWVWCYAAKMPCEARSPKHWVRAMGVLYLPADEQKHPDGPERSCEMIWRSWQRGMRDEADAIAAFQAEGAATGAQMTFIPIPSGKFKMVDEFEAEVEVTLEKAYAMAKYPVTN